VLRVQVASDGGGVGSEPQTRCCLLCSVLFSLNRQCRTGRLLCSWPRRLYCASMLYDRGRRCSSVLLPERQHPCCRPSAGTLLSGQRCCWLPSECSHRASGSWSLLVERSSGGVHTDSKNLLRGVGVDQAHQTPSFKERSAGRLPGRKRTKPANEALDMHHRQ